MHYYSPRAYSNLRSNFTLPSARSISRWMETVDCQPGFLTDVINQVSGSDWASTYVSSDDCYVYRRFKTNFWSASVCCLPVWTALYVSTGNKIVSPTIVHIKSLNPASILAKKANCSKKTLQNIMLLLASRYRPVTLRCRNFPFLHASLFRGLCPV